VALTAGSVGSLLVLRLTSVLVLLALLVLPVLLVLLACLLLACLLFACFGCSARPTAPGEAVWSSTLACVSSSVGSVDQRPAEPAEPAVSSAS
jgi:hypothetical protein